MVANKKKKISELFNFLPKSKIKAGEGLENGKYPFYTCSNELTKYYDEYTFEPNKLIFGTGGSASLHYASEPFATSTDCYVIEAKELNVDVKYVYYYLKNNFQILEDGFKGAGLKHISKDYLSNIMIEYPDIEEQQRIVKILDKADEIRTKKKLANEKLDEFLKSTFIDMFGDPVTNPKGFIVTKLSNLTTLVSSGSTPLGGASTYLTQGILFIRSQNVLMNKFKFDDVAYISEETHNKMSRTKVNKYDVLLNITGASIGRVNYFEGEDGSANVNQHVCIIRPVLEKIMPQYLTFFIGNDFFQRKIIRENSGATRQALNFQQIKNFEIPVPSIMLQNQFAQIVQKVEAQKEKNQKVIEQMDNLFNSLMQQAFNSSL